MPHVIFNWHQLAGSVCLRPAATAALFRLVSLSGLLCWGGIFCKKIFFLRILFYIQLQFHVNSTFRHILENWQHVQPLSAISIQTSLKCTLYWTSEVNVISHFFKWLDTDTHLWFSLCSQLSELAHTPFYLSNLKRDPVQVMKWGIFTQDWVTPKAILGSVTSVLPPGLLDNKTGPEKCLH